MISEASTADGRPRPSHAGTIHLESVENNRPPDRPTCARSRHLINRDVIQNVDTHITQLTAAIAHMTAMLNQVNGVPIPSAMQEIDAKILRAHGRRE